MPASDPTGQTPETKTELCLAEDQSSEIIITFSPPTRRLRCLGSVARMALTPEQAGDLLYRLRKTLNAHRQMERARRQSSEHVE